MDLSYVFRDPKSMKAASHITPDPEETGPRTHSSGPQGKSGANIRALPASSVKTSSNIPSLKPSAARLNRQILSD